MYAVIETGGKQYRVSAGDVIEVEKLCGSAGDTVELKAIMTVDNDKVVTGAEVTTKVTGKILGQGKDKKVVVFTYKAKKNVRRKLGHRQPFTRIKIEKIV